MKIFSPVFVKVVKLICINEHQDNHGVDDDCQPETEHNLAPHAEGKLETKQEDKEKDHVQNTETGHAFAGDSHRKQRDRHHPDPELREECFHKMADLLHGLILFWMLMW